MSREDEIAQGLREPSGCLTFPLDALEYSQGHEDATNGAPPPKGITSASYDLGRARFMREQDEKARLADWMRRDSERRDAAMKKVLPPEAYEEWKRKDAALKAGASLIDLEG